MDRFSQGIVLYSDVESKNTYLELWGGSTKHPDVMYRFDDWQDKCAWLSEEDLIFQWIFYCASRLSFPCHTKKLAEFGLELGDFL